MKNSLNTIGNCIAITSTIFQTDEFFRYLSIGLTIISVLVSLIFTIYKWYKTSHADNEIDEEDAKQLLEIADEAIKNIKASINKE